MELATLISEFSSDTITNVTIVVAHSSGSGAFGDVDCGYVSRCMDQLDSWEEIQLMPFTDDEAQEYVCNVCPQFNVNLQELKEQQTTTLTCCLNVPGNEQWKMPHGKWKKR